VLLIVGKFVVIVRTPCRLKLMLAAIATNINFRSFNFMKRESVVKVLELETFSSNLTSVYCSGRCWV
jgi:hypothetical protein